MRKRLLHENKKMTEIFEEILIQFPATRACDGVVSSLPISPIPCQLFNLASRHLFFPRFLLCPPALFAAMANGVICSAKYQVTRHLFRLFCLCQSKFKLKYIAYRIDKQKCTYSARIPIQTERFLLATSKWAC